MKKERWFAITHKEAGGEETLVGFSQALVFNRKDQAQKYFKEAGYGTTYKKRNCEKKCRYRIKRIYI